jgi:hypothetical protein
MVARRAPQPPVHLADQLAAAGREVRQIHDQLVSVLARCAGGAGDSVRRGGVVNPWCYYYGGLRRSTASSSEGCLTCSKQP